MKKRVSPRRAARSPKPRERGSTPRGPVSRIESIKRVAYAMGLLGVVAIPINDGLHYGVLVQRANDAHPYLMDDNRYLDDPHDALDWATVTATIARGVKA